MKKIVAAGAATAVAAGALAVPALAATKTVQVKDNVFVADDDHRQQGHDGQVGLEGQGPAQRHGHQGPGEVRSTTQVKGSFSKKLTTKGTYTILCTIHAPGMKMTITVK